jgi:glucose-1-phosphate adenylyltransferase
MRNVICLVLGGGKGTRLFPLTQYRSKPAVPLAGKYRIIDIPISNCLNSGLNKIYLLTQFNSVSLHRHIRDTYKFDRFSGGFVEILAAQQSQEAAESDWYQGTADAVRKNLRYIEQEGVEHVLILSGDQIYRMNFADMMATHRGSRADVTIATTPVAASQAHAFGIMRFDESGRVLGFVEKPKTPEALEPVRTDPAWLKTRGIEAGGRDCLANMGIYLFNRDVLVELLRSTTHEDFGKEVFPMAIQTKRVFVHLFDGYWEDIGTIKNYFQANIDLASRNPPFKFVTPDAPIYTQSRSLPASRIEAATIKDSLVADGSLIGDGTTIENSVIGLRCRIGRNVTIRNAIIMGADYYQPEEHRRYDLESGRPPIGIGDGSVIEGAIIDKNCRVGRDVKLIPSPITDTDRDFDPLLVRDEVLVLPKGAELPDGWTPKESRQTG